MRYRFFNSGFVIALALLACVLALVWLWAAPDWTRVDEARRFVQGLVLAALVGVVGAAAMNFVLLRRRGRADAEIEAALRQLSSLEMDAPSCLNASHDLRPAVEALRSKIEALRSRIVELEIERNSLKAILGAMAEGVIVVDNQKCILMANAAARKMLDLPDGELVGTPLLDVTRQPDLVGNITLSISASQSCSFEFQLAVDRGPGLTAGRTHILAHCAPFRDEPRSLYGAVAVLHDISELRRLERMRTEFVANVSHELRTPLTSLLGYLETLHEGSWSDTDQARRFVEVCQRQAERLSRIVEDLLRLSRLENPQAEIAAKEIDLGEVVNAAVDQCRPIATKRGIQLKWNIPEAPAIIWGDRGLLVQALCNLIENAINYNREKGKVDVVLAYSQRADPHQPAFWEMAVIDTGIGIPPEATGRIFERFYRVDKARSRERGGTGLGLSIVKHIALAHGASVHVKSVVDQGSTFSIRFKSLDRRPAPTAVAV